MRTTVDLDPHLLKRLRAEAHRQGLSFKELLIRVVRRGLEDRPGRAAGPYRCPTFHLGSSAHPLDRALALAGALEDEETVRELARRK